MWQIFCVLILDSKKTRNSLTCKHGQKQARESGLSSHASQTCLDGLPVVTAGTGLKALDAAHRAPNGTSQEFACGHRALIRDCKTRVKHRPFHVSRG